MNARRLWTLTVCAGLLWFSVLEAVGQEAQSTKPAKTNCLDGGSFLLIEIKTTNQYLSYGAEGQWDRYEFPAGVTARPIIAAAGPLGIGGSRQGIAGFKLQGDSISDLIAVDSAGGFRKHKLPTPIRGSLTPIVSNGLVYYVARGKVHAFSGKTGTWDTLVAPQLPDTATNDGVIQSTGVVEHDGRLLVEFENQIAIFSVQTGKWSTAALARR